MRTSRIGALVLIISSVLTLQACNSNPSRTDDWRRGYTSPTYLHNNYWSNDWNNSRYYNNHIYKDNNKKWNRDRDQKWNRDRDKKWDYDRDKWRRDRDRNSNWSQNRSINRDRAERNVRQYLNRNNQNWNNL